MYPKGQQHIADGSIDLDGSAIKCALVTSSYTPSDSHEFFDTSVSASETSGTGYTAGGQTLASKQVTSTLANSWTSSWAASTAYTAGDIVRPTTGNGHLYLCVTGGTSAASEPTWPTVAYNQVTDNTATWMEAGTAAIIWDAADPAWTSSTVTARYAVYYVAGTAGVSDYLISYVDFGADESTTADTFTVVIDSTGIARFLVGA